MPDLLIRNVSVELKHRIERQARINDTSLSETAKNLIEKGFDRAVSKRLLGTELFNLIPQEYRGDDLIFEIPDGPDEPPDFS